MNPLIRHSAWHVPRPLDLRAMREGALFFVGRHDFSAFTANPGAMPGDRPVRGTLSRCEVKRSGRLLTFKIVGDGFLYKMCRGIVGTLVQVGLGKFRGRNQSDAGLQGPAGRRHDGPRPRAVRSATVAWPARTLIISICGTPRKSGSLLS